jgi:hypothetical protein
MTRAAPITILILALPTGAHAVCTMDTECKGERICEEGRCVSPRLSPARPARPAPRPARTWHATRPRSPRPEPAPVAPTTRSAEPETAFPSLLGPRRASVSPFFEPPRVVASPTPPEPAPEPALAPPLPTLALAVPVPRPRPTRVVGAYLDTSFLYNASAHGELEHAGSRPGLHLAGYRAFRDGFHLGGYFAYTHTTEDLELVRGTLFALHRNTWSAGVSFKAGGWIRERAWLGFAFDHGLCVYKQTLGGLDRTDVSTWMHAFPRLHLDVLVLKRPVVVGLSVGAGPELLVSEHGVGAYTSVTAGLVIGR